jgi:hypothetical protein
MKKYILLIAVGIMVLGLVTGCSSMLNKRNPQTVPETAILDTSSQPLKFSYQIRDSLDAQVTFENRKAYNAVQLGLTLLDKCRIKDYVPAIEEQEFFPEFFAMVNVNVSDGLLYISEKEAINFSKAMFAEYQKKVTPEDHLKAMRQRQVVENFSIIP